MSNYRVLNISEGGYYRKPVKVSTHTSHKRQVDIAVRVNIPSHETVEFGTLEIKDCGLPIRHDSGNLLIRKLIATRFTADLFNSAGNLTIDTLIVDVDGSHLTMDDYKTYHMDALGQFFSRLKTNVENVTINNIEARIKGKQVQGMMLSEPYNNYTNFSIGKGKVDIVMDYPYALNANQLNESYIDVGDNGILIKERKSTKFETSNVTIKKYNNNQTIVLNDKANTVYFA